MIIYIVEFQQGRVPWVVFSTSEDAVTWLKQQANPQEYVIIPWQVSKLNSSGVVVAA